MLRLIRRVVSLVRMLPTLDFPNPPTGILPEILCAPSEVDFGFNVIAYRVTTHYSMTWTYNHDQCEMELKNVSSARECPWFSPLVIILGITC